MKAALHSLANIAGETRMGNNVFLTSAAEENLKSLIYDKASRSPKLIPSVSEFKTLSEEIYKSQSLIFTANFW